MQHHSITKGFSSYPLLCNIHQVLGTQNGRGLEKGMQGICSLNLFIGAYQAEKQR
jgi:hypothetical protein